MAVSRSRRASNRQSWTWATSLGAHGVHWSFTTCSPSLEAGQLPRRPRLPRSIRTWARETPAASQARDRDSLRELNATHGTDSNKTPDQLLAVMPLVVGIVSAGLTFYRAGVENHAKLLADKLD